MPIALVKKTTVRPVTVSVRCESTKLPKLTAKLNAFVEKKKEIDRSRWEKLKEATRVIDHIAKSDVKETVELFKSLVPKATTTVDEDTTNETTSP